MTGSWAPHGLWPVGAEDLEVFAKAKPPDVTYDEALSR